MHPDNTHRELFKSIGRVLAQRRESKGLTQEQVAEVLQIGTEAVSRMERGITMPTIQRMAELADIYGCGIEELVIATSTRTIDSASDSFVMLCWFMVLLRVPAGKGIQGDNPVLWVNLIAVVGDPQHTHIVLCGNLANESIDIALVGFIQHVLSKTSLRVG